jgi:polygalacturonase
MKQTLVLIILLFSLNISANQRLDVRDFGAVGDGITKDTKAFQEAITQGAKEKRVVYIPGGEFYIGPLILFSNT